MLIYVVTECLCEDSSLKTGKPVSEKNTMTVDMRCPTMTRCPAIESWHAQCSCVVPLFRRISHVWFDVYINCIIVIIIRITIVIINISRGIITKDQWNCRLLFTIMIWCLTWGFASSSETDFNVCQSNHLAYIRMSGCKSIKYNYIFLQCNLVDPVQRSENWLLCLQTRQWVENTKHLHEFHLLKKMTRSSWKQRKTCSSCCCNTYSNWIPPTLIMTLDMLPFTCLVFKAIWR